MGRNVVVDMRIRVGASCAFLAVLGGTLSACSFGDDGAAPLPEGSAAADTAASPPAVEDPWILPIEDRPELFNPCTEISLEDLAAAGLENPTPRPQAEDHSDNPPLHQCGWEADNFTTYVGSHWTTLDDFSNSKYETLEPRADFHGKPAVYVRPINAGDDEPCGIATQTSFGMVSIDFVPRTEFMSTPRFEEASSTCQWADQIAKGLAGSLPLEDS